MTVTGNNNVKYLQLHHHWSRIFWINVMFFYWHWSKKNNPKPLDSIPSETLPLQWYCKVSQKKVRKEEKDITLLRSSPPLLSNAYFLPIDASQCPKWFLGNTGCFKIQTSKTFSWRIYVVQTNTQYPGDKKHSEQNLHELIIVLCILPSYAFCWV